MKFIYVYNKEERDVLMTLGYYLLQSDELSDVYVFVNDTDKPLLFGLNTCTYSDTLTL